MELEFQEGNSDEIVHYGNWDVSQNKDMVLYWLKESQQRHCANGFPAEGGIVGSLYASLNILLTSPCIKTNLASLCVAIASAAVSTHFRTASVRTGAGVDTVGFAFDVVLPTAVVHLGGGIGSGVLVGVEVDVIFDCCDATIQW